MSSTRASTKSNAPTMDTVSHLTARERLLVAQAVYEYGSNAWPDISRVLSKHPLISRPKGFFSPQECQKIYGHLMGEAGYECSDETHAPHAQLHLKLSQKHYQARVIELRRLLLEEEEKFKALTRQIDDIREGRWDEAIAKELGIHAETPIAKLEGGMRAEAEIINEPHFEHVEEAVLPVPEEESMDVSEEPAISTASNTEQQEEIATPMSQLSAEIRPASTIDILEKESPTHDQVPSPIEDVGTALEEIKLSAVSDESDGQNVVPITPSETTPILVSREERTQEELKAIEALEELSRLEPIDVVPLSMQDPSPSTQINDVLDQIGAQTPQDYKDAIIITGDEMISDSAKERSKSLLSNTELQRPISMMPSTTLPGKRKIADVDVASPDPNRDRKKIRDESVPTDDEALSGRRRPRSTLDSSVPSIKRFQTVITMLHSQISQHRNGNIFHSPIRESEAPDYHEIVKRPMDLKTIKMRIKDGVITNSDDYQREIYLMFANAMMYNRPKSDIAKMAREMLNESEEHIRDFRQTEGFMTRGKR